jgi:hypothetical protein
MAKMSLSTMDIQSLMDLRKRIDKRLMEMTELHPLGWTGLRPFKWRPAGRVPLQI